MRDRTEYYREYNLRNPRREEKRAWHKAHPRPYAGYGRQYYLEHREEMLARMKTHSDKNVVFLKSGARVVIPNKPVNIYMCRLCGTEARKLVYHHWDDTHPEHGIWVCRPCHRTCEDVERGIVDTYLEVKQEMLQNSC